MARLTPTEREERRKKVQQEALESVAARGQFNFRLEGKDIKRLYELAGRRRQPVSAMVREWVLERLDTEESNKHQTPIWAQGLEQRLMHTEVCLLMALSLLGDPNQKNREAFTKKLRLHIQRHCDVDADEELRALLA
jgi:hypothetical protein